MFAKDCKKIIGCLALLTSLSFALLVLTDMPFLTQLTTLFAVLAVFAMYFFRDPEIRIPKTEGILSPADAEIVNVSGRKIEAFLSLFDVHVNRAPVSGKILKINYIKGSFLPAFLSRASKNEREEMMIQSKRGTIKVVRIAGIIARRITTWVKEGDSVEAGQRIGMIRFGSRYELHLPQKLTPKVKVGDKVKAGTTVIAS